MIPDPAAAPQSPAAASTDEAISDLVSRAADDPVPLIPFTDEELAVLDGGSAAEAITPQPWLDGRDEPAQALARQVALRGLTIRRLAVPVGLGEDGAMNLVVHPDIRAALAMRRSAEVAVVADQRRMSGGSRLGHGRRCVLHCYQDGVLEEIIEPAGVHAFTMTTRAGAGQRLAAFADPAGAAGRGPAGRPRTVTAGQTASARYLTAIEQLSRETGGWRTAGGAGTAPRGAGGARRGGAGAHREVSADGGPAARQLTVYTFSDHVMLSEPAIDGDALALTPVSTQALVQRLAALLPSAGLR